jgi:anaerobic magnesium-protoporphyrin IX monomethyl ester cyclase
MKKNIDCLLIGHNEMPFDAYEKTVRLMGEDSGAYRDLSKSVLYQNDNAYSITDIINLVNKENIEKGTFRPFNMLETFSNSIAYLGTYLHRRGHTFDYVNSFQAEKDKLEDLLRNHTVRSIGIITTLYVSVFPILEIIEFLKQFNSTAKIIIGGPFVSTQIRTQQSQTDTEYLFQSIGADCYVNSSQGEATLTKVLDAILNNKDFGSINNIYYKKGDKYIVNPLETENNKLYENTADWSLFANGVRDHAAVRTAISCPYKCSFCGFPQHAGAYQTTDVEPIIAELDLLTKYSSVKSVHFVDDTFNIPKERFKSLLRSMIEREYNFKWHSYYRCQFSDDETMQLMKESGCEGVFLGIESGSNKILKNMDKAATAEQYTKGIGFLKKYEIPMFGSFIIGFPGETTETVKETVRFIEENGVDFYRTQQWYLEPITPIWNQKEKYGIKGQSFEWSHDTMDSKMANDIVDENFLSIRNSVWLPQYNFDFDNLLHLLHRNKTIEDLKGFLRIFNEGVKERILNPSVKEVNPSILKKLHRSWEGRRSSLLRAAAEEDPGLAVNF